MANQTPTSAQNVDATPDDDDDKAQMPPPPRALRQKLQVHDPSKSTFDIVNFLEKRGVFGYTTTLEILSPDNKEPKHFKIASQLIGLCATPEDPQCYHKVLDQAGIAPNALNFDLSTLPRPRSLALAKTIRAQNWIFRCCCCSGPDSLRLRPSADLEDAGDSVARLRFIRWLWEDAAVRKFQKLSPNNTMLIRLWYRGQFVQPLIRSSVLPKGKDKLAKSWGNWPFKQASRDDIESAGYEGAGSSVKTMSASMAEKEAQKETCSLKIAITVTKEDGVSGALEELEGLDVVFDDNLDEEGETLTHLYVDLGYGREDEWYRNFSQLGKSQLRIKTG